MAVKNHPPLFCVAFAKRCERHPPNSTERLGSRRSHHRNSRGPKIAPTTAHPEIMTPYQSAMNGIESSGQ